MNKTLKKKYQKAQKSLTKKKVESIPEELKFIITLDESRKTQMRDYMKRTSTGIGALSLLYLTEFDYLALPLIAIGSLIIFLQGLKYIKQDPELERIYKYIKNLSKDEKHIFSQKHHNIRSVIRYQSVLNYFFYYGFIFIGIVSIINTYMAITDKY